MDRAQYTIQSAVTAANHGAGDHLMQTYLKSSDVHSINEVTETTPSGYGYLHPSS